MKIKGVMGGSKNRGTPIEFTPTEKPEVAVKARIPLEAPEGQQWWAESVKVSSTNHTPLGTPKTGKPFANNSYVADGEVTIRALVHEGDKYLPAQKKNFHIEFQDAVDDMGMPELEIKTFEFT